MPDRRQRVGYRPPAASFHGRSVLTLESRRSPELALLVVNYGGEPVIAPALREVPLAANEHARAFADDLIGGAYDMVVLMTGVGTRLLLQLAGSAGVGTAFTAALTTTPVFARGPKPVAALREVGVVPWLTAPAPNTWREILATLDARAPGACGGARIAVQEYGGPNPELVHALVARGAAVTTVPIYQWALPLDVEPLRAAIHGILAEQIDVLLLTASIQLVHVLQVGADMGVEPRLRRALSRLVIASIGPMASEELRRQGLPIDVESSHTKMGFLVKEAAERCAELLRLKRQVA